MSILEVVNVSREVSWLPWAVQYFFLIGISVACFFMTVPGLVGVDDAQRRFTRLALTGALVCGIVAPVALLADLHQPGRFWRFYASPNFKSWMAWGAFFIPAYLAGLFLYAWAALKSELALSDKSASTLLRFAAVFTAILGALVLLYTGMELMVVRSRPLWNTPFLPLQLGVTAVVGAAGLVLVLDAVSGERDNATEKAAARWLKYGLAVTMVFGALWLALGWFGLSRTHSAAFQSVAHLKSWQLTAIWLGLAVIAPLVILAIKPVGAGWLTGLLALHAAWMFRWTVFIGAQTLPKTGAGEYGYQLPLGHDGLLGIAGTAGLWLAVYVIVTSLMPGSATASASKAAHPAHAA